MPETNILSRYYWLVLYIQIKSLCATQHFVKFSKVCFPASLGSLPMISFSHAQDTARNEDPNLVVWSMHLLNKFFSSESDVFENAIDTQVWFCGFSL